MIQHNNYLKEINMSTESKNIHAMVMALSRGEHEQATALSSEIIQAKTAKITEAKAIADSKDGEGDDKECDDLTEMPDVANVVAKGAGKAAAGTAGK